MKYFALAALVGVSSAIQHRHHHKHHHKATPLSNFHPWPRNNWESADIDADNSRASNDIPEHCISKLHCGITSDRQVAQPTTTGPQPVGGKIIYPANNMIAQVGSYADATPLSNFHPWPRNNWESADIDADNSRASNDIPEHCIGKLHCGITSDRQVAQPTTTGPQPVGGKIIYPANNMLADLQADATPLANFHPWPRNNWESADIDADNSRASNDIPEHCIGKLHCGITSDRQVAEPTTTGPQPVGGKIIYPANNMLADLQQEGAPAAKKEDRYVPYKGYKLSKALNGLQHCPDFNERMTLLDGKTRGIPYPLAGYNCRQDYGL